MGDGVNPTLDRLIREAILKRRMIRFALHERVRIAEPHDYGIRNGVPQLLAYQVAGESSSGRLPGWRWAKLSEITNVEILSDSFDGGRAAPSGKHSTWDHLFLRVAPK